MLYRTRCYHTRTFLCVVTAFFMKKILHKASSKHAKVVAYIEKITQFPYPDIDLSGRNLKWTLMITQSHPCTDA